MIKVNCAWWEMVMSYIYSASAAGRRRLNPAAPRGRGMPSAHVHAMCVLA